MKIDNIEVCNPIVELVKLLEAYDYTIIEEKVSDYHFNEVFIKMKSNTSKKLLYINMANITQPEQGLFCCGCHWSGVKLNN
ncbi:hypothetical protein ACQVA2_09135 [Citrobacter sp. OP27]